MSRRYVKSESTGSHTNHRPSFSYLTSLVGRQVQIFRGGPNSKTGTLVDVQEDYLVLFAEGTMHFYNLRHVQSITENTKSPVVGILPEEVERYEANTFKKLFEHWLGTRIQVNNGPESRVGLLVEVKSDFIALLTNEDGIVYYNLEHIKLVTELVQPEEKEEFPEGSSATCFGDVFNRLLHKWVSCNRTGPEAVEGILVGGKGGYYTIINNEEILRIHPFHIKSISEGAKGTFKQEDGESKEEESHQESSSQEERREESSSSSEESRHKSSSRSNRRGSNSKHSYSGRERRRGETTILESIDYSWKLGINE